MTIASEVSYASAVGAVDLDSTNPTAWAFAWDCSTQSTLKTSPAARDTILNMGYNRAYDYYDLSYSSSLTSGVFVVLSSIRIKSGEEIRDVGFGAHENSYEIAKERAIENLVTFSEFSSSTGMSFTIEYRSPFSCTSGVVSVEKDGNFTGTSTAPYAGPVDQLPEEDITVIDPGVTILPSPAVEDAYVWIYTSSAGDLTDEYQFMQGTDQRADFNLTVSPYDNTTANFEVISSTGLDLELSLITDDTPEVVATDLSSTHSIYQNVNANYRSKLQLRIVNFETLAVGSYSATIRIEPRFTYPVEKKIYFVVHDTSWDGTLTCCTNSSGDFDKDGVINSEDAFPTDPSEQKDFDNDGVGDNADADDDNDGALDTDEIIANSDPYHVDSDNDGLTDGYELALGLDPRHAQYQIGVGDYDACILKTANHEIICTSKGFPASNWQATAIDSSARLNCGANINNVFCWGTFRTQTYPLSSHSHTAGAAKRLVTLSTYSTDENFRYCVLGDSGVECYQLNTAYGNQPLKLNVPDTSGAFDLKTDGYKFCAVKSDYNSVCWNYPVNNSASYLVPLDNKVFGEPQAFNGNLITSKIAPNSSCNLYFDQMQCNLFTGPRVLPYVSDVDDNGISDKAESLAFLGQYTNKFSRLNCDAGTDQLAIPEGDVITLAAQNTELNPVNTQYTWTLGQGNSIFYLSDSGASINYTTPQVGINDGLAYYRLTCSNPDNGDTNEDIIKVEVNNINHAPVTDASATLLKVGYGETTVLDASNSYDVDNDQLIYYWELGSNSYSSQVITTILNSFNDSARVTSFKAPLTSGYINFILYVFDGKIQTQQPFTISFMAANQLPLVTAYNTSFSVNEGENFTLAIDSASDPDSSAPLSYSWDLPAEYQGVLTEQELAQSSISFLATQVDYNQVFTFIIHVSDERRGVTSKEFRVGVVNVEEPVIDPILPPTLPPIVVGPVEPLPELPAPTPVDPVDDTTTTAPEDTSSGGGNTNIWFLLLMIALIVARGNFRTRLQSH